MSVHSLSAGDPIMERNRNRRNDFEFKTHRNRRNDLEFKTHRNQSII